jgi:phosphonatase-like hydrolase
VPKLVIFDLAGTTVRDDGQVATAFVAALGDYGITIEPPQLAAVRGASKAEAVRRLVPPGPEQARTASAVYERFRERLAAEYSARGVRSVADAGSIFQELRSCGIRVALTTGFDREITDLLLASLGWKDHAVDAVVCGDDVPQGRPAPFLIFRAMETTGVSAVRDVANVGDTALDLQAADNAGVRWNIGVLSGAGRREDLSREPHTLLIDSIADLPSDVRRLS